MFGMRPVVAIPFWAVPFYYLFALLFAATAIVAMILIAAALIAAGAALIAVIWVIKWIVLCVRARGRVPPPKLDMTPLKKQFGRAPRVRAPQHLERRPGGELSDGVYLTDGPVTKERIREWKRKNGYDA